MRLQRWSTMAVLSVAFLSCGGGSSPSTPVAVATPAPTPTPTPVPAPTPEPSPEGEPPVDKTTPPVRITARLYVVEDPSGRVYDYSSTKDGTPIIPLGYKFRVDMTAKDKKNKETMGTGHPEWTYDPENLIDVDSFANEFQPRLRASRAGVFNVYSTLDKIQSNTITVILGEP
jgi:hypothetical protein